MQHKTLEDLTSDKLFICMNIYTCN